MATHSSILAWRIPGTKEPGRLQSMGFTRVGHDWANKPAPSIKHNMVNQLYFNKFCLKKKKIKKEKRKKKEEEGEGKEEGENEEEGEVFLGTEQNPPSPDFFPIRMCSLCECSRNSSLWPLRIWWTDIHIPLFRFQSLRKVVMFNEDLLAYVCQAYAVSCSALTTTQREMLSYCPHLTDEETAERPRD